MVPFGGGLVIAKSRRACPVGLHDAVGKPTGQARRLISRTLIISELAYVSQHITVQRSLPYLARPLRRKHYTIPIKQAIGSAGSMIMESRSLWDARCRQRESGSRDLHVGFERVVLKDIPPRTIRGSVALDMTDNFDDLLPIPDISLSSK